MLFLQPLQLIYQPNHWLFWKGTSIKKKVTGGIKVSNSRFTMFYTMLKIWKAEIPERAVVSPISLLISRRLEHVDYHLQPIRQELPSHVQDGNNFPKKNKEYKKSTLKHFESSFWYFQLFWKKLFVSWTCYGISCLSSCKW